MSLSQPAWYCVRTMNKHELLAYNHLKQLDGVEAFHPRLRSQQRWRDRIQERVEPLFPCYVFARFVLADEIDRVRFTSGVRDVVHFSDSWPTIPDLAIAELREGVGETEVLERPLPALLPGTEVDILMGPFRGLRAVVRYHMPSSQRVELLMDMLCRKTTVEMKLNDIAIPQSYPAAMLV
jgi:transcriptional antiterminator RfaH